MQGHEQINADGKAFNGNWKAVLVAVGVAVTAAAIGAAWVIQQIFTAIASAF